VYPLIYIFINNVGPPSLNVIETSKTPSLFSLHVPLELKFESFHCSNCSKTFLYLEKRKEKPKNTEVQTTFPRPVNINANITIKFF
jgi:hypothetical protein